MNARGERRSSGVGRYRTVSVIEAEVDPSLRREIMWFAVDTRGAVSVEHDDEHVEFPGDTLATSCAGGQANSVAFRSVLAIPQSGPVSERPASRRRLQQRANVAAPISTSLSIPRSRDDASTTLRGRTLARGGPTGAGSARAKVLRILRAFTSS
jgi:hypothetical protein